MIFFSQIDSDEATPTDAPTPESETAFVAFARVFSGVLTPGKELYVLGMCNLIRWKITGHQSLCFQLATSLESRN